jgi:acylphosphatase
MANKRVELIIRGRVQGVFFRAAAQREARRLGITGWVKNRTDGSLELTAEGEEESIRELSGWAQHGPSAARVDHVDVRWRGYSGEFSEFSIIE